MFYVTDRDLRWIERAVAAVNRAFELDSRLPEAFVARARIAYAQEDFEQAADYARMAIARRSDCESSWDLLGRALFASKRWQEAADLVERAIRATGDDYNVYVPYGNALHALGWTEAAGALHRRHAEVLERQLELEDRIKRPQRSRTSLDWAWPGGPPMSSGERADPRAAGPPRRSRRGTPLLSSRKVKIWRDLNGHDTFADEMRCPRRVPVFHGGLPGRPGSSRRPAPDSSRCELVAPT
jgi:tetratricopeptide (TPR) repeat protein